MNGRQGRPHAAEAAASRKANGRSPGDGQQHRGPDWWDPGSRRLAAGRTSLIVDPPDGHMPPMTNEAQKAAAARAQSRRRGPRRAGRSRPEGACLCWGSAGPPMMPAPYNDDVQFVQTKNYVVIVNEMIHDARAVPMDGRPHGTRALDRRSGRAWEGQTLVVEPSTSSTRRA